MNGRRTRKCTGAARTRRIQNEILRQGPSRWKLLWIPKYQRHYFYHAQTKVGEANGEIHAESRRTQKPTQPNRTRWGLSTRKSPNLSTMRMLSNGTPSSDKMLMFVKSHPPHGATVRYQSMEAQISSVADCQCNA